MNTTKTTHLTHFLPSDRNIEQFALRLGRNWFKRSRRKYTEENKTKMRQKQVKRLEIRPDLGHKKEQQNNILSQTKSTKEGEEEKHRTNSVCIKIFSKSL